MRRIVVVVAAAAALFMVPAAATPAPHAATDPSVLALDNRWHCSPCTLTVYVSPDFPATMQTIIDEQMTAISASPYIDMVRTTDGTNSSIQMRPGIDGFGTNVKNKGPWRVWARIQLDYKWFDWDGMPFVTCHELTIAVGFNDGAPPNSDPNTCPTADHFAMLQAAYGS